jgi:hypothetical protein
MKTGAQVPDDRSLAGDECRFMSQTGHWMDHSNQDITRLRPSRFAW